MPFTFYGFHVTNEANDHLCKVDKFRVPSEARDEFPRHTRRTHRVLAGQQGFVRAYLPEQVDGAGQFNVVTSVEWESAAALAGAHPAVAAAHAEAGFDPAEFLAHAGIEADLANYREVTR